MRKRLLNKNFLFPIISNLVAIIVFIIGWNIMKSIYIIAETDIKMSIIFLITLIVSMVAYAWIINITIAIIDMISDNKKKK